MISSGRPVVTTLFSRGSKLGQVADFLFMNQNVGVLQLGLERGGIRQEIR